MIHCDIICVVLQLAGLVLEITGVFFMANQFIKIVKKRDVLRLMASAFMEGKAASGAVKVHELNEENKLQALRGLSFILFGFGLQFLGVFVSLPCCSFLKRNESPVVITQPASCDQPETE
jgi:hypothetical protein